MRIRAQAINKCLSEPSLCIKFGKCANMRNIGGHDLPHQARSCRGHGGHDPEMTNFCMLPPNGISNLEIYIGKQGFCPSKVHIQAGFCPPGMTSSYVVACIWIKFLLFLLVVSGNTTKEYMKNIVIPTTFLPTKSCP